MAAAYEGRTILWRPQPRQAAFMRRSEDEALYGGAAGGGKSDALVIEALRQVDRPNYRGLIVRKTYPQLSELIDKTMRYYKPVFPAAKYNGSAHCWTFPSGAKIYFGSMFRTQDKYNYQGKQFDFIGVDELTHFTWDEYSYLMSRNRPSGAGTQVYMRATANPGGIGHGWVKARFITPAPPGTRMVQLVDVKKPDGSVEKMRRTRIFIPSTVFDNPALLENDPGYYLSPDGVMAWSGSLPAKVSGALDTGKLTAADWAMGGQLDARYYLYLHRRADGDGSGRLLVYDTEKGLWHEESPAGTEMVSTGQQLYLWDGSALWAAGSDRETEGEEEANLRFEAVTGDIGMSMPDDKYISRVTLRLDALAHTVVTVAVSYDGGAWETVGSCAVTQEHQRVNLPFVPRRHDLMRLKFSGTGQMTLRSMAFTAADAAGARVNGAVPRK